MNNRHIDWASQFANAVIGQNIAIEKHDAETGNKFAKKYIEASDALINAGNEGIEAFASLLSDDRVAVRAMAASYLLPFRTNEALLVLREAANGEGITALGAFMTLKRWEGSSARH
jgi:hypothetical protein